MSNQLYPKDSTDSPLTYHSWDDIPQNINNKRSAETAKLSSDEESAPMKALRRENARLKSFNNKQSYKLLELKQAVAEIRAESALLANSAATQKTATNAPRSNSQ